MSRRNFLKNITDPKLFFGGGGWQGLGVTSLLFTRSAMGCLITTESQDLGLTFHPKDGAFFLRYSVPVTILGRWDPHRPQGEHPLLVSLTLIGVIVFIQTVFSILFHISASHTKLYAVIDCVCGFITLFSHVWTKKRHRLLRMNLRGFGTHITAA